VCVCVCECVSLSALTRTEAFPLLALTSFVGSTCPMERTAAPRPSSPQYFIMSARFSLQVLLLATVAEREREGEREGEREREKERACVKEKGE
jgi:hypothetical protein